MNKLVIFSSVLATLIAVVSPYNFDDPDYNQVLVDELEDLYSNSFSNVRIRRDASEEEKCHKKKHKSCCGEEVMKKIFTDSKEARETCFKEITGKDKPEKPHHHPRPFDPFDCEKMEKKKQEMICVHQCGGQKFKYIDADGDIKPDEFVSYLKEKLAAAKYLEPVQDKIIMGCLEEIKNATETNKSTGKCKPAGIVSEFCLFKQIMVNCPEDHLKDNEFCKKMQERIKQGKNGPPPPPPDH